MADSRNRNDDPIFQFLHLVASGSLDDLRMALEAGADPNGQDERGHTPLSVAIDARDLEKIRLLIAQGADLEQTDDLNNTPLRCAVSNDYVEGVAYLLSLGAERGFHPKYPLKKIDLTPVIDNSVMPPELVVILSEEEWRASQEETRKHLTEWGNNPTVEPMIHDVQSVAVLKLFLEAGDDLSLAPQEIRRAYAGLSTGGELAVSREEFQAHKTRQFGVRNPEPMDFSFWRDMVRVGCNSYFATKTFDEPSPFLSESYAPIWCFERFGASLTPLPDGRLIQIAGEHEDYYDPDFCIYNDVVVFDGHGDFRIYGYPREVFLPTDFHTATLAGDAIYIIGNLGYRDERRRGFTPVYRLTLETWAIEPVATTGENPGWISKHRANIDRERNAIRIVGGTIVVDGEGEDEEHIANRHEFELNLQTLSWRRFSS